MIKKYSSSYLMSMTKKELIEYIRDLENALSTETSWYNIQTERLKYLYECLQTKNINVLEMIEQHDHLAAIECDTKQKKGT